MHHVFFINPAAGKCDSTEAIAAQVRALFADRPEDSFDLKISRFPGHMTQLTRDFCLENHPARLYACGGDGTFHEVVAGAAEFDHVSVTVFAYGTGNDFIKSFSDPLAFRKLEALVDGHEIPLDIIQCGERYAANICSVGLDARIGTDVARFKRLPLVNGFGAYCLSTAHHVCKGVAQDCTIVIDDGAPIAGLQTLVCIANGRWYGGGFHPVPEAELDDGLLDVLIIAPVSRLTIATVIGKFAKGLYKDLPNIATHHRCKSITVSTDREIVFNLDGEAIYGTTATFTVLPQKIRFFAPQGVHCRPALEEKETVTV